MTEEPADQFYGERRVVFTDPSGYTWMFMSNIKAMSEDEIRAAASAMAD
jgi:uncharacterized glyoxalase superfamily protein PhnB